MLLGFRWGLGASSCPKDPQRLYPCRAEGRRPPSWLLPLPPQHSRSHASARSARCPISARRRLSPQPRRLPIGCFPSGTTSGRPIAAPIYLPSHEASALIGGAAPRGARPLQRFSGGRGGGSEEGERHRERAWRRRERARGQREPPWSCCGHGWGTPRTSTTCCASRWAATGLSCPASTR